MVRFICSYISNTIYDSIRRRRNISVGAEPPRTVRKSGNAQLFERDGTKTLKDLKALREAALPPKVARRRRGKGRN
jgi:hypothetical protein